jgi:hypothetical protein
VKINCPSCQKQLSIDETKLPMKEVSFPCPVCKAKVNVDRRNLEGPAAAAAVGEGEDDPADDELGEKGIIVGTDSPALRAAVRSVGLTPMHFPTADAARDFYLQEYPAIVILAPAQMTPPPLADYAPLTSVSPIDRRKGFFVLVADNLRSLDGNAAFLYNVNLVVSSKDLAQFPRIHRDADLYHKKLYLSMNALAAEHR